MNITVVSNALMGRSGTPAPGSKLGYKINILIFKKNFSTLQILNY
jgi:hypothetical protein